MDSIFSVIGGSGSTYLINTLRQRFSVGNKPDTVFRPQIPELRVGDVNVNQGSLHERAPGFEVRCEETLEDFLLRYVDFLRNDAGRTAVFNTCAELGLFSRFRIPDVIFVVRHPLDAYVSWAKPERHAPVINYLGGITSRDAIEFYGRRWTRFTDDLFRLRELGLLGGVIRYEFARTDVQSLSGLAWLFSDFDVSRRNTSVLSEEAVAILEKIVRPNFFRLYETWQL